MLQPELGYILLYTFAYTFLKSIFLGHNAFEKSQTSKGHGEAHIKLKIGPNNCSEHFNRAPGSFVSLFYIQDHFDMSLDY